MAYMSQEKKATLAPAIKAIFKKYGVKASIAVHHHSSLVVNIKSSPIDFFESYNRIAPKHNRGWGEFNPLHDNMTVNPYWYHDHFDGKAKEFFDELVPAMNVGNHNRSDIQSDYFDVGWYVDINIGKWNKPYQLEVERTITHTDGSKSTVKILTKF